MDQSNLEGFTFFFSLTEVVGVTLVVMVGIWTGHYRGGFAWSSNPALQFNWHPLLMTIGFIFLYGNSLMTYRAFRNMPKNQLKLGHASLFLTAFILAVIGLSAVFDFHNLSSIPNMYSLHSWVGLTSVLLFSCQWVSGLVAFLLPALNTSYKVMYLPVHIFFGLNGFALAVVSAVLGLNEKAIFAIPDDYKMFSAEGIVINVIGMMILIFAMLVVYIVIEPRYKRIALPEDSILLDRGNTQFPPQNIPLEAAGSKSNPINNRS